MRKLLFAFFTLLTTLSFAQAKGTVFGKVLDKEMDNEPLPFVTVTVVGTTVGTTTDFEGNYSLQLKPGTYKIKFEFIGYDSIEKTVNVTSGSKLAQEVILTSAANAIKDVVITVTINKETSEALTQVQKEATVVVESVGAEQLSSQGVSDAAAATAKVTGVAKQQGSSKVYVRGLGDRYNATTLNGLPLPSNDPSNKNISLDLFSTDVLQNVGISKTFAADFTGDVSGANINIESKQASPKSIFAVGIATGLNSQTTFNDFKSIDGANYFGVADHTKLPITNLNNYVFTDNMSANQTTALPNIGVTLNGGNRIKFNNGQSFSYFLVGSFDNNYKFIDGFNVNNRTATNMGSNFYDAKEYSYSTSKLAMGNFEYEFNPNHKVLFNSIFIHSNDQKIEDYKGDLNDVDDVNIILQTQTQNKLLVNQLLSKHQFTDRYSVDLGLAFNTIRNDEPNRKKNSFTLNDNGDNIFYTGSWRDNSRYYQNLAENDLALKIDNKLYFKNKENEKSNNFLNFGYSYRNTQRNFDAYYLDHAQISSSNVIDKNDISTTLNQQNLTNGDFKLWTGWGFGSNALDPFNYQGKKDIHTLNANINYNITNKVFVNIGTRFETIGMDVHWLTNLTSGYTNIDKQYLLPSLNVKYAVNDINQFRFSASKTYTLPQFKEVAEFVYEGVNSTDQGNANLQPSNNYNIDAKFEHFAENGALVSVATFGKIIKNSINRILINSAADNAFSYENTGDASVLGMEFEYKTTLYSFGTDADEKNSKLKFGANSTLMYTKQNLEATGLFRPTKSTAALEGAAPFILNGDISYNLKYKKQETNAALVLNYQSDKLYSIGNNSGDVGLENIVQKSITTLDFVTKQKFNEKTALKFSVKNILNPSIELVRDLENPLVNSSFKRGVDVSLSLDYKF